MALHDDVERRRQIRRSVNIGWRRNEMPRELSLLFLQPVDV